ncbi:MAG: GNAT family N-acetyltransferase, partial [Polyangiaceae bacterium]
MEHRLADGTRILVRPLQPEDASELRRVFAQLSPETRERRFLTAVEALSDEALRYLTEVDQESHVALVATTDSLDLKSERGLGVARFIRLKEDPEAAEAAVTVADDMQHRGVGGALLRELAKIAHDKGVRRFRGEILASNEPMKNLMEKLGANLVRTESD